jgi:hypothetical protein
LASFRLAAYAWLSLLNRACSRSFSASNRLDFLLVGPCPLLSRAPEGQRFDSLGPDAGQFPEGFHGLGIIRVDQRFLKAFLRFQNDAFSFEPGIEGILLCADGLEGWYWLTWLTKP